MAHFLALMHAGTGMVLKVLTAPMRTHDLNGTVELHPELLPGDVLAGDRGFCSFAHLALLLGRGVQAVFRIHQRLIVDFTTGRPHTVPDKAWRGLPRSRWIKAFGFEDQLVEWFKPVQCPQWMPGEQFASLPASLTLRELRYHVAIKGFRSEKIALVTTLIDAHSIRRRNWRRCISGGGLSRQVSAI